MGRKERREEARIREARQEHRIIPANGDEYEMNKSLCGGIERKGCSGETYQNNIQGAENTTRCARARWWSPANVDVSFSDNQINGAACIMPYTW